MRRSKSRGFYSILFYSILFVSCDTSFNEPVREYFEYWSTTCQVGKVEFSSAKTIINGLENLSAKEQIQIDVFAINPKGFKLLQKGEGQCFSLQNSGATLSYSDYSETQVDPTYIKITAKLTDASEGQTITLSGGLYPENRTGWSESQLRESAPELFTSVSFIQNTPPDNIKNLRVPNEFFGATGKHYVSFEIPDQSLNRNKNSTYKISYYLRESDGSVYYKGTETLSLAENKNTSGSTTFLYYFDGQEDNLFYEYTVQVIGPRGLKSEVYSTIPGLGVNELNEPTVTVEDLNGLKDDDDYECVEVENENDAVSFTAVKADEGDTLTVRVDGSEVASGSYTVSGIGQHTIVAMSAKDGSRPISVTKKIRIVKKQKEPTYAAPENLNVTEETDGVTCIEAESDTVVSYTITAESGCTMTVKNSCGNTSVTSNTNSHTLTLASLNGDNSRINSLTVIVKKQYCTDKTFTKKVTLVKAIQEPTIRIYKNSGNDIITASSSAPEESGYGDYTCYDLPLTTSGTGNANFEVTSGPGESVSAEIDGSPATESGGKYALSLGPQTVTLTVTKANCTTKTFTKKFYIQGLLSDPTITYTGIHDGTDSSGNPVYKFSYLTYDEMQVSVTAGNKGNTVSVKVNGVTKVASGFSLAPDSTYTISVVQSRKYCKTTPAYERTVAVKIKPITLSMQATKYGELSAWIKGFETSDPFDVRGAIAINGNIIFNYEKNKYRISQNCWYTLEDTDYSYSGTFNSPSDELTISFSNFRRNIGLGNDKQFGNHSKSNTLSNCKYGKNNGSESDAGSNWTFIVDTIHGSSDGHVRPRVKFTARE